MTREPPTSNYSLVDELFLILEEDRFRDPILESIRESTLSREGVRIWVGQALLVVKEFPRFISAIHSYCPNRDAQQLLAENLWEEHGRGLAERDHFYLMRRLANSLGVTDDSISAIEPFPETTDYIEHCLAVTREARFVESMAAIGIGIEYHMPRFFGALAAALQANYGLSATDVDYLMVHVNEDEDHARRSMEIIQAHCETEEDQQRIRHALKSMLEVKRRFAESLYCRCIAAS